MSSHVFLVGTERLFHSSIIRDVFSLCQFSVHLKAFKFCQQAKSELTVSNDQEYLDLLKHNKLELKGAYINIGLRNGVIAVLLHDALPSLVESLQRSRTPPIEQITVLVVLTALVWKRNK